MGGKKKNFDENDKKTSARDRKEKQKADASAKQRAQAEDAYWAAAGDGAKSKAQKKKDEADARAAEAAKKKAEAKRLAEAEDKAMGSFGKKAQNNGKVKPALTLPTLPSVPPVLLCLGAWCICQLHGVKRHRASSNDITVCQMTAFERSKVKEKDAKAHQQAAEEKAMAAKRQVTEEDFARQMRLDEANSNRYALHGTPCSRQDGHVREGCWGWGQCCSFGTSHRPWPWSLRFQRLGRLTLAMIFCDQLSWAW